MNDDDEIEDLFSGGEEDPSEGDDIPQQSEEEDEPESLAPEVDPDEEKAEAEEETEGVEEDASVIAPSAMELLLSQYNITGGVVEFSDGKTGHIDSFDMETQLKIVKDVIAQSQESVEDKFKLTDKETELLNEFRKDTTKSIDVILSEVVDREVAQALQSNKKPGNVDYDNMDGVVLMESLLREENPEATDEAIADMVEAAKESPTFSIAVKAMRAHKNAEQNAVNEAWETERALELEATNEKRTEAIVGKVRDVDTIYGWKVLDDAKNKVIADLVERDDEGKTGFERDVLGNPEQMFKAKWLLDNAETLFKQMDTYYKSQLKANFDKGVEEGARKKQTTPKINSTKPAEEAGKKTPAKPKAQEGKVYELNDVYE